MNSVVTASIVPPKGRLFFFQLGPVQEFIAQARSTRDLWSGSYLLSWMTGQVIHSLHEKARTIASGGAVLVFPQLGGDKSPMMRWIEGNRNQANAKAATLPTVPNRFLATLPDDFTATHAKEVLSQVFDYHLSLANRQPVTEWERICAACQRWFAGQNPELYASRDARRGVAIDPLDLWHRQLAGFWQPTWLLWPAAEDAAVSDADHLKFFYETPIGQRWQKENPAQAPDAWMVRYHLALHRFDARRQTRNFSAWTGEIGLHKYSLSGKEEAVADKEWLEKIPRGQIGKGNPLNHLFRNDDPLGAPNLVKRVWHKAYLEKAEGEGGMGLNKERLESLPGQPVRGSYFDIPSVPGVAAFPVAWKIWSKRKHPAMQQFWPAVEKLDKYLDLHLPDKNDWAGETPEAWLARVDWEVFRNDFWLEQLRSAHAANDSDWEGLARTGSAALARLRTEEKLGSPSFYYAVLAGDGDGIGKWLSGEPPNAGGTEARLFDLHKDFHERVSHGIARFSMENSRLSRLVEDVRKEGPAQDYPFQGKIIYAGGEDVLAILPADQVIDCARTLRKEYQKVMPHLSAQARFTYSVGIAIGHIKEPLQDMIEAARLAESRAKNKLGRNALAVTVFKRSGETIEWGCPFSHEQKDPSAALELLQFVQGSDSQGNPHFRSKLDDPAYEPPISGKFPHRLAELLARYQTYQTRNGLPDFSKPEALSEELRKIAEREVEWAVSRQCKNLAEAEKLDLLQLCRAYLEELKVRCAPLCEFYHLFALEAFIARQGE